MTFVVQPLGTVNRCVSLDIVGDGGTMAMTTSFPAGRHALVGFLKGILILRRAVEMSRITSQRCGSESHRRLYLRLSLDRYNAKTPKITTQLKLLFDFTPNPEMAFFDAFSISCPWGTALHQSSYFRTVSRLEITMTRPWSTAKYGRSAVARAIANG